MPGHYWPHLIISLGVGRQRELDGGREVIRTFFFALRASSQFILIFSLKNLITDYFFFVFLYQYSLEDLQRRKAHLQEVEARPRVARQQTVNSE